MSPELLRAPGKCDESEQRPTKQLKKIAVEPGSLCDQHQDQDNDEQKDTWVEMASWHGMENCSQGSDGQASHKSTINLSGNVFLIQLHSRFYTFCWTTATIRDCINVVYFCMCDQTFAAQFCEDDDLGGGLCHLWSSDDALLVVEITIIIMRVTRMMWKRSLSSCSFRPQAKLRKMAQLQRKKNPIKKKHKEDEATWPWSLFPCMLLTCVSTHYRTD